MKNIKIRIKFLISSIIIVLEYVSRKKYNDIFKISRVNGLNIIKIQFPVELLNITVFKVIFNINGTFRLKNVFLREYQFDPGHRYQNSRRP